MPNLLAQAIDCDDPDRAAKIIRDAFGIESDDVVNYCFPAEWSADRERRAPVHRRVAQDRSALSGLVTHPAVGFILSGAQPQMQIQLSAQSLVLRKYHWSAEIAVLNQKAALRPYFCRARPASNRLQTNGDWTDEKAVAHSSRAGIGGWTRGSS